MQVNIYVRRATVINRKDQQVASQMRIRRNWWRDVKQTIEKHLRSPPPISANSEIKRRKKKESRRIFFRIKRPRMFNKGNKTRGSKEKVGSCYWSCGLNQLRTGHFRKRPCTNTHTQLKKKVVQQLLDAVGELQKKESALGQSNQKSSRHLALIIRQCPRQYRPNFQPIDPRNNLQVYRT